MSLGFNGFHNLTLKEGHIITGKQLKSKYSQVFKKYNVAFSRLAAIANMPETEELSTASITQLLQGTITSQNTLLVRHKTRNSSFTGLLDTHTITLTYHDDVPPDG
jgi:hypothetical protein